MKNTPSGLDSRLTLPGGLILPAGFDPVLGDLINQVNRPDHDAWMSQVHRVGGCAHPLHLSGSTRTVNASTGAVDYAFDSREAPGGVVLVRCRNRRAAVCPSCARLYQGDTYHLVRAGLDGSKGIPDTVVTHPRVFATLTAPSFGAVHTRRAATQRSAKNGTGPCHPRRTPACEHGQRTACFARHGEDDERIGTPLCPQCYDYPAAVVWQASVGDLWERFVLQLPRSLAKLTGRTRKAVKTEVRMSYVKIVEYQQRGLVHVHAVIRADGISTEPDEGPTVVRPPRWVSAQLLEQAVSVAVQSVRVPVDGGGAGTWELGWGVEHDVHDITASGGDQSPGKVAAYVAKYATKATEVTGWDASGRDSSPRAVHTRAMARTAYALAEVPELADLKLGRWVKALAYRGHVSSKSRHYSTTLGALRQARAAHQAAAGRSRSGKEPTTDELVTGSHWELTGFGYTPGQALLAADVARDLELNRAAAREAGAARSRAGGRDRLGRDDGARERGSRVAGGPE